MSNMKKELYDELDGLSPKLRDLKQTPDGLKLPEGYFDTLENRVLTQLEAQGERRISTESASTNWGIRVNRRYWAAAAAVAVLAVAIWQFAGPNPDNPLADASQTVADASHGDVVVESLSEEEIYLEEHILDFEPELLAEIDDESLENAIIESTRQQPAASNPKKHKASKVDDELDQLLEELTDEELEDIL